MRVSRVLLPKVHGPPDTVKADVDMAFLSMDDAEFWRHLPKKKGHIVGGGLSGIATFILGKTKDNPPSAPATIRWQ